MIRVMETTYQPPEPEPEDDPTALEAEPDELPAPMTADVAAHDPTVDDTEHDDVPNGSPSEP